MMLNQTARLASHALCPKVELTKNNSTLVILHLPSRSGSSKGWLPTLVETLENASVPARQYQQEGS
jgi:hypothetical protein